MSHLRSTSHTGACDAVTSMWLRHRFPIPPEHLDMTHPRDVVEHFLRAFYAGDAETARQYLHDDVAFDGPAASFTSAEDYLATSAHVASIVHRFEIERTFVDDDDVCVFSRLYTRALTESLLVADWYHVQGERIASIRTIFDTGQFASGSAQQ